MLDEHRLDSSGQQTASCLRSLHVPPSLASAALSWDNSRHASLDRPDLTSNEGLHCMAVYVMLHSVLLNAIVSIIVTVTLNVDSIS